VLGCGDVVAWMSPRERLFELTLAGVLMTRIPAVSKLLKFNN